jgi:hypothetical protein
MYLKVMNLMKAKPYLWFVLSLLFLPYSIFEYRVLVPIIYGIFSIGVEKMENFFLDFARVCLRIFLFFLKGDAQNLSFVLWFFISIVLFSIAFSIYFKLIKISLIEEEEDRQSSIKNIFTELFMGTKITVYLILASGLFFLWTMVVLLPPAPSFLQWITMFSLLFQWILIVIYFFGWVTYVFIYRDISMRRVSICIQRNFAEIFFHTALLLLFLGLIIFSLYVLNAFMLQIGFIGFLADLFGVYLSSVMKGFVFCFFIVFMLKFFDEKYQREEEGI